MSGMSAWAANLLRSQSRSSSTLRRKNNLLTPNVLAAGVSAGATTLTLKTPTGRLAGTAVQGAQFTITGITGTYTVSSDSKTPASGVLPITFTPAIPVGQSALTGAAVTFSQPYGETSYPVLVRQVSDTDARGIEKGEGVRLLPFDALKPAPRMGDTLDGIPITRVETVDGDDGIAFYRCHVDEGRT